TTTLPLGSCERLDCTAAPRSRLDVRVRDRGQALAWSWRRGPSLPMAMLGQPTLVGGTRYALCVRDGAGGLVFHDELDAGGSCDAQPCWRSVGTSGFAYHNTTATNALTSLRLKAAGRGGAQATAAARGATLVGALPSTLPLTVQVEADTGACLGATFDTSEVTIRGRHRLTAVQR
ncbi:MAG: hypothetical protein ACREQL_04145, partial [Candidatus Binatia bacterium]